MKSTIGLTLDVALCTNCRACELACSFTKEGVFSPEFSRIRIVPVHLQGVNVPIFCIHCEDAPCMEICPFEAIERDTKLSCIKIDAALCTNCDLCLDVCPIGAVDIPHNCQTAIACDLCDGAPVCVEHCIYGALRFEGRLSSAFPRIDLNLDGETPDERRWRIATTMAKEIREISEASS
jgi:Fe-S-cluster-containing hydrogenase component 2